MKKYFITMAMLLLGSIACFLGNLFFPEARASAAEWTEAAEIDGIGSVLPGDGTQVSVLYLPLDTANRCAYMYAPQSMRSASMIKVFIMADVMRHVKNGSMRLDSPIVLSEDDMVGGSGILSGYAPGSVLSLQEIVTLMITESDNTATNILIDLLGMDEINSYIRSNGYKHSILQRKMMDFDAAAAGRENYTSVYDLGLFFTRIYDGQCVDPSLDALMIEILKGQTDDEVLPTALPGAVIAHKTGELPGSCSDGGIVFGGRNSVLVIMTDDYGSREGAIASMIRIARFVTEG